MAESRDRKLKRRYRPKLEALEALRLLDAAAPALFAVPFEQAPVPSFSTAEPGFEPQLADAAARAPRAGHTEWDLALDDHATWSFMEESATESVPVVEGDRVDFDGSVTAGLNQLNRYLASAWARAGIAPQHREDCTQAVHATLLQQRGRDDYDRLLDSIGRSSVSQVLNRDTDGGPDFFRAVDMVKKRAQRQRVFLPLEHARDVTTSWSTDADPHWRDALDEAIDRKLDAREADLMRATLQGFTPAEIARQWGLAPKTVSNEKTRVFHKLRAALAAEVVNN